MKEAPATTAGGITIITATNTQLKKRAKQENKIVHIPILPIINHLNTKTENMYYNHSSAQKSGGYARRMHHPFYQSNQRAPVNIYKTENSFELMVFAPGRVKENFHAKVVDKELIVSYQPAAGIPQPHWIQREYSRGAFERRFMVDGTIDTTNIKASYTDGVLLITLPLIPGKEAPKQEVPIN